MDTLIKKGPDTLLVPSTGWMMQTGGFYDVCSYSLRELFRCLVLLSLILWVLLLGTFKQISGTTEQKVENIDFQNVNSVLLIYVIVIFRVLYSL